ncbi:MAG: amidohydrolase [Actinobacteria bacterium]|nr:amidohydrolase [Actinomycetota bacterium]
MAITEAEPTASKNAWRQITPGVEGWTRTARPGDPNKYFMVSTDCHVTEPLSFLRNVEPEYLDRIPRTEEREDGSKWMITEGNQPMMVVPGAKTKTVQEQQVFERAEHNRHSGSRMEDEDLLRVKSGRSIEQRLADQLVDGVDAELLFPNTGLLCWATPDPRFAMAMCRAWNRWAHDHVGEHMQGPNPRILPMALIASGDIDGAMAEVRWAAEHGFRGVCLGNSPAYGPNVPGSLQYNDPAFEPLWSTIEETGLVITFHVSTGRDPRAVGGNGGAIINYVCHSMETTIEPMVQLITSGVIERHPGIRAGLVESGIGFLPWMLEAMDYAYKAHHFWVRPVIPDLPSEYFRRNCFATFQEDHVGLALVEQLDLVDNVMWANDYPHHEGSWPHSAAAIERMMGHLREDSRAKILGLNAARVFGLTPARG